MSPLGYLKVAGVVAIVVGIGYSYLWTYSQGKTNGAAVYIQDAIKKASLQDERDLKIRKEEREQAQMMYDISRRDLQRKVNSLEQIRKDLSKLTCANELVPDGTIGVLNSQQLAINP